MHNFTAVWSCYSFMYTCDSFDTGWLSICYVLCRYAKKLGYDNNFSSQVVRSLYTYFFKLMHRWAIFWFSHINLLKQAIQPKWDIQKRDPFSAISTTIYLAKIGKFCVDVCLSSSFEWNWKLMHSHLFICCGSKSLRKILWIISYTCVFLSC